MEHQTAHLLPPKTQSPQSQMATSSRPGISIVQSPAPRLKFRRTLRHSEPYLNASQPEGAEPMGKQPSKVSVNFRPHPRTLPCRRISSTKKLLGGNPASAEKEKSAEFLPRPRKTWPACGTAQSL